MDLILVPGEYPGVLFVLARGARAAHRVRDRIRRQDEPDDLNESPTTARLLNVFHPLYTPLYDLSVEVSCALIRRAT